MPGADDDQVGRCILVILNNRLDYYGTTANKAERLEGQSLGSDIVSSEAFNCDPAVTSLADELGVVGKKRL